MAEELEEMPKGLHSIDAAQLVLQTLNVLPLTCIKLLDDNSPQIGVDTRHKLCMTPFVFISRETLANKTTVRSLMESAVPANSQTF